MTLNLAEIDNLPPQLQALRDDLLSEPRDDNALVLYRDDPLACWYSVTSSGKRDDFGASECGWLNEYADTRPL